MLITVSGLSKYFGESPVLKNISFHIDSGAKVGLIGANGAGKTTLFRVLAGQEDFEGELYKNASLKIGYMQQSVGAQNGEITAYDYVLSSFSRLIRIERELAALGEEIGRKGGGTDALLNRQARLSEEFLRGDGLTYRARSRSMLLGLGFSPEETALEVKKLSGGQRTRLSLAAMLLSDADLLLLDEPTNHLDFSSAAYLENFLLTSRNAFIVISHDRYFLDKVTNKTMEIENCALTQYDGSYSEFARKKREVFAASVKKYEQTGREIKRLESMIEQQKRWGRERNFITAASKRKSVDRLKETLVKPRTDAPQMKIKLNPSQGSANDVLRIENLAKRFDAKTLFENFDFELHSGERVFIIGENGCGKSTLFKILQGKMCPDSGKILFGNRVTPAFYDQTQSDLSPQNTVADEFWSRYPDMTESQVRNILAAFLFRGEDVFKNVGLLSGGEKARLALACLMSKGANLLFLDEPTNHLDIAAREALGEALDAYDGTLAVITHDRYLINRTADRILAFEQGEITCYEGGYDDYLKNKKEFLEETVLQKKEPSDYKLKKEARSARRRLEGARKRAEDEIGEVERLKDELSRQMQAAADDYEKLLEISAQLARADERITELLFRWEEADNALSEINGEGLTQ